MGVFVFIKGSWCEGGDRVEGVIFVGRVCNLVKGVDKGQSV